MILMTVENYDKVKVSPSGAIIASQGGFSINRTWMWQGVESTGTRIPVPSSVDYAEGLGPAGQGSPLTPLLVEIEPYAGSGLVYDFSVDMQVVTASTSQTGLEIAVVGSNDNFATQTALATCSIEFAANTGASNPALGESVRLHVTDLGFASGYKQVAVTLLNAAGGLIYTPDDVSLVIEEYGTN
jgi:hypothetical protein